MTEASSFQGPNTADVSFPSPATRSSFWNIAFSGYLEFLMMDKVHNPVILRLLLIVKESHVPKPVILYRRGWINKPLGP
jgi:hypothetical protein